MVWNHRIRRQNRTECHPRLLLSLCLFVSLILSATCPLARASRLFLMPESLGSVGNPPSPLPQAAGTPSCGRAPQPPHPTPGITEARIPFTGLPVNPRPWAPTANPRARQEEGPQERVGKGGSTVGPGGKSGLLPPVAPALTCVDALAAWALGSIFLGCGSGSWTLWSPPKLQGSGPGQCLLQD